jgi:hypothetical protein
MGNGKEVPKKSPIKQTPLRRPGQSIWERKLDLIMDQFLPWIIVAAMFGLCVMEWLHYFMKTPPQPLLMTLILAAAIAYAIWKWRRLNPEIERLRLGQSGEIYVGQLLEGLRRYGYEVFHDVVDGEHNIDHVLIGPGGVFTIDTKTVSKAEGQKDVLYDGERVTIDGRSPDRDPVIQALACARSLRVILGGASGGSVDVQPVVVYPFWYVKPVFPAPKVWVLNEKFLVYKVIPKLPRRLGNMEVVRLADKLATYVRHREELEAAKG